MSDSQIQDYGRLPHGDLGVGKRPDELPRPVATPFDMTTNEAATLLGIPWRTMRDWITTGKVTSERRGHRYYLRRRDVERLAEQRRLPS